MPDNSVFRKETGSASVTALHMPLNRCTFTFEMQKGSCFRADWQNNLLNYTFLNHEKETVRPWNLIYADPETSANAGYQDLSEK